jgi:signal transduction histidine kinase/transcriptional regulator with GAF, ATPase, and Fis domain
LLHATLPADGATGDLASFSPEGFRVQWLLEEREGGLQVGDVIIRAGGHTADEWLSGAPPGSEWRPGAIVPYEIVRAGQPMTLQIRLALLPLSALLQRWAPQFLASLAVLAVGSYVFWKRPQELPSCLLMLFCVSTASHYWVDAYNFQFTLLPDGWRFWLHLLIEEGTFTLTYAAICHFALVFPAPHPLVQRFPRAAAALLYTMNPLIIGLAIVLSPTWSTALRNGNAASFGGVVVQVGLAVGVCIRSLRVASDPVARAQIRWFFWGAGISLVVALPGYLIPMALIGRPLIPHPLVMLLPAAIPYVYAIAVLRYRLFDIEFLINRTLVYGTLTAILGGLYLVLVRLLTLLVQSALHWHDDTVVVFVATLAVVLAFTPLRRRVQQLVDHAFYRNKVDMQRIVLEVGRRLPMTMVPEKLEALLAQELPARLRIVYASLLVLDPGEERFAPISGAAGSAALPVDHPLPVHLRRTEQPLLRLQPPADVPAAAQAFLDGNQTELSIPLIVGGRLVAIYNLAAKRSGRAYDRDEIRMLHTLGQQAAVAVEHSRLLQAAERQTRELAVLHQAAVAVSSTLQMEEALAMIARQFGQALDVSCVYICSWDETTALSVTWEEWVRPGDEEGDSDVGRVYNMRDYPTTMRALQERRPLVILATDPTIDPLDRKEAELDGWKSQLIVPLVSGEAVIGYAELWEVRWERRFSAAEVRICQTLAADAAVAIERARLFEAEREQRQLAEALQDAAAIVSSTLDLAQVLDRILEQTARVVAGDACNIMLIEGEQCRVVRWRGYEAFGLGSSIPGLSLTVAQYPSLVTMMQKGEPSVVPDTAADAQWFNLEGWEWLRSFVGAPIRVAGHTVGFLNVDGTRAGQFGPAEARQLQTFADHAATALENARLFDDAWRRTAYLEAQNAVIAAAAVALDLPELLEVTLEHSMRGLGLDMGYIWVANQHVVRNLSTEVGQALAWLVRSPNQEVIARVVVDDWLRVAPGEIMSAVLPIVVRYGVRSSITVPILQEGQPIGGLVLASSLHRPWSAEDVALAEAIGRQVGGAFERFYLVAKTHEQAQQVQQIIRTVPEGVLLLGTDGHILVANPTAREYLAALGSTPTDDHLVQLGGYPLADFLVPPEEGVPREVAVDAPAHRVFELLAQPLEASSDIGGWVLLIRDVTRERDTQAQVQQQNRLAALGQLAGGIAHDFNNILTVILFSAEMSLYERELPPNMIRDLEAILTAGRKGAQLVRQILDFSRRAWLDTRPVDLQIVIGEIADILKRALPENVTIVVDADPGDYTVSADPTRIQQALMNLALNAKDAMPQGGQLYVRLSNLEVGGATEPPAADMAPGRWVCLAVRDTGTGIAPDVAAHLFEPFFTTKPVGQGTGLGLAQVYGIVKQHQGYIVVNTLVGQGTAFRIYLPAHGGAGRPEGEHAESAQALPRGKGETILLVEDDAAVRQYCQEILETLGYRVLTAVNGRDAVQVYRSGAQVDLLITDLVMPEMSGQELISELRQRASNLKTLVMTGYAVSDLRELKDYGVLEVVSKPVEMQVLAQTVRRILDSR